MSSPGRLRWTALLVLAAAGVGDPVDAQRPRTELGLPAPSGRIAFAPPQVEEHTLPGGVTVFYLEDHSLPLVDVYARFAAGYGRFPRERYGAGTALPALLRTGGGAGLGPQELEERLEHFAVQASFGGSGEAVTAALNTMATHLDTAFTLWAGMLQNPGFDSSVVRVWRGQELESVRRRGDDPGRLAYSEYNRLMYGEHPVGWELEEADLAPDRVNPEELRWFHERILCPDHLILGVSGAVAWDRIRPHLEAFVSGLPACAEPLPPAPQVDPGADPGVYLIPRPVTQSVIVAAQTASLKQSDDPAYFASRIGNAILGASGMGSRLMQTIRTREGLAYGASSLWTTPRRYDGLLGATTRVRGEATGTAIALLLETMDSMAQSSVPDREVRTTVAEQVNGFVFNFQAPSQVVTRRMAYRAAGLPDDWLESYVSGIQSVDPEQVRATYARFLDLDRMVILVVGDPGAIPGGPTALEQFGPVTILPLEN